MNKQSKKPTIWFFTFQRFGIIFMFMSGKGREGSVAAGASRIAECCSHFLPQENSWKCEGIAIGKRDFSNRQESSWKRERIAIGIGKRDFSSRQSYGLRLGRMLQRHHR